MNDAFTEILFNVKFSSLLSEEVLLAALVCIMF